MSSTAARISTRGKRGQARRDREGGDEHLGQGRPRVRGAVGLKDTSLPASSRAACGRSSTAIPSRRRASTSRTATGFVLMPRRTPRRSAPPASSPARRRRSSASGSRRSRSRPPGARCARSSCFSARCERPPTSRKDSRSRCRRSRAIAEVKALVDALVALEQALAITTPIGIELMVETPRALIGEDGRIALPGLVAAAEGRCTAVASRRLRSHRDHREPRDHRR